MEVDPVPNELKVPQCIENYLCAKRFSLRKYQQNMEKRKSLYVLCPSNQSKYLIFDLGLTNLL